VKALKDNPINDDVVKSSKKKYKLSVMFLYCQKRESKDESVKQYGDSLMTVRERKREIKFNVVKGKNKY